MPASGRDATTGSRMVEILVGVQVDDEAGYTRYRTAMLPLLIRHGGSFGFDARVSQVLKPTSAAGINRVFTIRFPDAEALEMFFADPAYLAVRRDSFDSSVSNTVRLGKYDVIESSQ